MRYSPFFGMIATCLAALSRQSPEARKGRALARGVDGESACQAIMANAIMRHRRNAFIGCVRRQRYQTWRKRPCNPSTTRSARGCHPCLRYDPLPMSPGRAHISETDCMAGVIGLELRCAERKFISLTSRVVWDSATSAETAAPDGRMIFSVGVGLFPHVVSGRKFRSFKLHLGAMLEAPEDCSLAARLPVQTERQWWATEPLC